MLAPIPSELLSFNVEEDGYYKHSYSSYGSNGKYVYTLEHCFDDG